MPAFNFRLQKVLDYRKQLEDQAALALAQAKMLQEQTKQKLTILQEKCFEEQQMLAKPQSLSPGELWLRNNYLQTLMYEVKQVQKQLMLCAEQVHICQQKLVERAKDHTILAKLKEKQSKNHGQQERLNEQRVYDETATIRYNACPF